MSIWDDHLTEQRGVGKGLLELFLTGKVRVGGREQGEKILEALGPRFGLWLELWDQKELRNVESPRREGGP